MDIFSRDFDIGTSALYFSIIMLATLFAWFAEKAEKRNKAMLVLLVTMLSLFCGLRGNGVGVDTNGYYDMFYEGLGGTWSLGRNLEIGFMLYTKGLIYAFRSPQLVFIVTAFLTNGFMIARLWELRKNGSFTLAIFAYMCIFYFMTFNCMRQLLAVALTFYATRYADRKKYILYGIFMILAISIHMSSILSLVYLLLNKKSTGFGLIKNIFYFAVIVAAYVFRNQLFSFIAVQTGYSLERYTVESSMGFMIFARTIIFVLAAINFHNEFKNADLTDADIATRRSNRYMVIQNYLIYAGLCFFGGFYGSKVSRVSWYFMPFEFQLVSYKGKSADITKLLLNGVIIVLLAYSFVCSVIGGRGMIPYHTCFYVE